MRAYCRSLPPGATFTFPTGALRLLAAARALAAEGEIILLAADKGHNNLDAWKQKGDPAISVHGSISVMVNLDLIGRFFHLLGSDDYSNSAPSLLGVESGAQTKFDIDQGSSSSGSLVLHSPISGGALDVLLAATPPLCSGVAKPAATMLPQATALFLQDIWGLGINEFFTLRDHVEDIVKSKKCTEVSCSTIVIQGDTLQKQANNDGEANKGANEEVGPSSSTSDGIIIEPLLSLEAIVSFFRISSWDADLLWQFGNDLLGQLKQGKTSNHQEIVHYIAQNLESIRHGYIESFDKSKEICLNLEKIEEFLKSQHS
uniref:Uncharacterized protein n=1 Tax=Heterosigma akashiwo TaxID=2829 RepID=A0A7S4DBT7_HETAK